MEGAQKMLIEKNQFGRNPGIVEKKLEIFSAFVRKTRWKNTSTQGTRAEKVPEKGSWK